MIISRQLREGMDLVRDKETLNIKSLTRTGRSCTALVINAKGREERLSITDMWNQKIKIKTSDTKPKQEKKKPELPTKKEISGFRRHEVKRAGGISVSYYDKNDKEVYGYWKHTNTK